jgi:hypothetical protein
MQQPCRHHTTPTYHVSCPFPSHTLSCTLSKLKSDTVSYRVMRNVIFLFSSPFLLPPLFTRNPKVKEWRQTDHPSVRYMHWSDQHDTDSTYSVHTERVTREHDIHTWYTAHVQCAHIIQHTCGVTWRLPSDVTVYASFVHCNTTDNTLMV